MRAPARCITKLKQGQIKKFHVSFRSKKTQQTQSFRVNQNTLNPDDFSFFPRRLKDNRRFRMRKRDVAKFKENNTTDGNFMILKTKPNAWYFCFPRTKETKQVPVYEDPIYQNVFLDPGVRTFQTFYSPDGVCGKIGGEAFSGQLKRLTDRHDKLWSVKDGSSTLSKTKKALKKRCAMLRHKLRNKVDDLHWQTCSMLCKTF